MTCLFTRNRIMKISIFTDEISSDDARALTLAREWGMEHVELRSLPSGRFPRLPDSELHDFGARLADSGLTLSGVSPGFFKCSINDPLVADEMANTVPRACEWALKLGTDRMSSFAFDRDGPAVSSLVIDRMAELASLVAACGCHLALENEASCWGGSGIEAVDILRQMGDGVGLCYDPGNSVRSGIPAPFPEEYRQISQFVAQVHMKNFDASDETWTLLEKGVVDWKGQLNALQTDDFDGFAVIETHTGISIDEFAPVDGDRKMASVIDASSLTQKEANSLRNLEFVRSCLSSSA
jgi:sugar phosphate isomerase/epimerase